MVSATPGDLELRMCGDEPTAEMIIRPTGAGHTSLSPACIALCLPAETAEHQGVEFF